MREPNFESSVFGIAAFSNYQTSHLSHAGFVKDATNEIVVFHSLIYFFHNPFSVLSLPVHGVPHDFDKLAGVHQCLAEIQRTGLQHHHEHEADTGHGS